MRSAVGLVFGVLALGWAVLLAVPLGLFGVLPFAILPRGRRERYTMRGAALWARAVLVSLGVRAEVTREGALPRNRGALFVCNHRSWLDPPLLIATTRSNGLSKIEVYRIPFVGQFGHLAGAVFFDRSSKAQRARARREVMDLVRSGHRVHLYPEGTRSRDGELRDKVHLTLVGDCWEAGLPVVPCAVYGTERTLPPTEQAAYPFQRCRLDIGPPMDPADHPSAEAFQEAVWREVCRRVGRLRVEAGEIPPGDPRAA